MAAPLSLEGLLQAAVHHRASDIHVVVGMPPVFRVDGEIVPGDGREVTVEDARRLAAEGISEEQRRRLEHNWELCVSYRFGEFDRARVTVYFRNGSPELAIRLAERTLRSRDELGLPPLIDELSRRTQGLILITGPTGVGKTTTFHYLIDRINAEQRKKVVTIEDPIEFVHVPKRSLVVQQELFTDVRDFQAALLHVLRQDPDVIGVGEMRHRDTLYTALVAAETGHLVVGTLHTPNAIQSIQRIVSAFPEGQQTEVRFMLAECLEAVLAQQLLPRATGPGRVLCHELLVGTPGIRNIIRENHIHKLYSELQAGRRHGMVTMDHSLLELYQQGDISYDTALRMARYPEAFRKRNA